MNNSIQDLVFKNRALFWDIDEIDFPNLDKEAILERFMAYGDMEDIREIERSMNPKELLETYGRIKSKKRINLEPETVNFFDIYFSRYEA